MSRITFLYWECLSRSDDGDPIRITVAECPRCGHRSTVSGFGIEALRACGDKMRAECPRAEGNTYTHEVFPALEIEFDLSPSRAPELEPTLRLQSNRKASKSSDVTVAESGPSGPEPIPGPLTAP